MKDKILYDQKTEIGHIQVIDTMYGEDAVCFLMVDGQMESAMYLDEERKNELLFPYMQQFDYAFLLNPLIQNTYLIGGGGFSYPKYYLSHYKKIKITVAELSKQIISLSHEYFRLNEMNIEDYSRMTILQGDGFEFLKTQNKFDLIINDAFLGRKSQGRNDEDTRQIHEHLNENGIYLVNMTGARKGLFSYRIHRYMKIVKKHFKYTTVIVCEEDRSPYESQNLLLVASDQQVLL